MPHGLAERSGCSRRRFFGCGSGTLRSGFGVRGEGGGGVGAAATSRRAAVAPIDPHAPVALRSWKGVYDTSVSPSDSTGAIGPTRYVELVNDQFAIYDRTNNGALSSGTPSAR